MNRKLKIIITGFDVFDSLTYNPSKIIIHFIDEYILNKKKENSSYERQQNECIKFFMNNRQYLNGLSTHDASAIEKEKTDLFNDILPHTGNKEHASNEKSGNLIYTQDQRTGKEKTGQSVMCDTSRYLDADQIKNHLTSLACFFHETNFEFIKSETCLVNKEAVDKLLHDIYKQWEEETEEEKPDEKEKQNLQKEHVIVIHMGVYTLANSVTLESAGTDLLIVNPEDARNKCKEDLTPKECMVTKINVQKIVKRVNTENNLDIRLSHDSGTYFCNYIYYKSMKVAHKHSIPVLFIHLPLFETVNFHDQVTTIKHIFSCLCKELTCTIA